MSQNPTDLLSERFKIYRQAQDRFRRATAAREAATVKVEELEAALRSAEHQDRVALGDALVDQSRPPQPEAAKARATLEEAKRELEALQYAEQRAGAALDRLPKENKAEWLQRASRTLGEARDAYKAAIVELARARDQLADEATLVSFLEYGVQTQPISAALRQRLSDGSIEHTTSPGSSKWCSTRPTPSRRKSSTRTGPCRSPSST